MNEPIDAQKKFYACWKKRREKKWLYAFCRSSVLWGLPTAVFMIFIRTHFKIECINLSECIITIIGFMAGGYFIGLWNFQSNEDVYLKCYANPDMQKGIEEMKFGKTWTTENLNLTLDGNILFVKNNLYWYDDTKVSFEDSNECLNSVMDDFQRLLKNKDFNQFANGKEIKIQLVDNSENRKIIMETVFKTQ